jgi:tyrosyl-tRNA synthetase
MVNRLKDAFEKAAHLPAAAQEALAEQLIEELDGEAAWDNTLAESQDLLDQMASKALEARKQGKTRSGGFDQL